MEKLVMALILFPFIWAIFPAISPNSKVRSGFIYIGCFIVAIMSIVTAVIWYQGGGSALTFDLPFNEIWNKVILVGDFVLMFVVIYQCYKHKKLIIALLAIAQTLLVAGMEVFGPEVAEKAALRFDWLTFIMILIIGVVGGAIGIYAMGYMHGYHIHHHKELKDRRNFFMAMVFVFYGAMFGLVFSANLIWMYFFWEITSITSFLLIGYTKSDEAINNSFKALWMNLLGGMGIAIAIAYLICMNGTTYLYDAIDIAVAKGSYAALVPIAMLAFAALTKSAQFPFSGWLLGAMVAPTPSSALLHSATMVKAGVYLLIRLATAMNGNYVGQMVYLVGGVTFLATACLAVTQSDGKKVLAYSTISNLGLIVACAGAGYQETIWAALFLVIFHAVSKSMLFQCVGAIENTTGSRDIEDMQGLGSRYPKLAFILMMGIAGMFLAPFGMLISKWAALKAFIDAPSALMVLIICFGSSITMFYWTKWLAKILGVSNKKDRDLTKPNEYVSMFFHSLLLIVLCAGFPTISEKIIEPLTFDMYGVSNKVLSDSNIIIMIIMIGAIFIVPMINYLITRNSVDKDVLAYMGGVNAGDNVNFNDAVGEPKELKVSNWYLDDIFGEKKLFVPTIIVTIFIIVIFLSIIVGGALR